ncbi:MAG: DNA primase, partial [Pseudomonadales bacterium]|nr:DNA primase [Pseudomonadales bacterium]
MSQVAQVKDAVSIVEIINERVALTPSGNYHRGLCPFHGEKSPSFFVDERIGHFRCFGCGESGDVLAFLEKYDSLTFREALEYLADRAGITLTKHVASSQDLLRARSLEALAAAAEFYQQNLGNSSLGQQAKNYLKNRQVSSNTIKYFGLGVATAGWQDLADHLQKKGFTRQEMVAAGLVIEKKTGGIFDRFRMRLMFPLKNHRGQVVGFSGRLLAEKEGEAKYINSPETALYHKGKMLYGLSENAQEIKKKNAMIIVEGEFDMISSYQAHVENVVAIKGSALTSDHAQIIARYTNLVYLALDGDEAGVKATHKAVSVLREVGVELKVVMSPGGQDPDDFARQDPGGWRKAVAKAVSAYEYFLIVTSKKYDLSTTTATLENKKTALKELAPLFATIDSL